MPCAIWTTIFRGRSFALMAEIKATNITWHEGHVGRDERGGLLKQKGATLWFTA